MPYAIEFKHRDSDSSGDGDFTHIRIEANWRLPDAWYRNTNQYIKDFVAAVTDYDAALSGVEAADRELADLDKKSRRAKAKLIRELLQSSPQGRKLLSSMGASSRKVLGALHSGALA